MDVVLDFLHLQFIYTCECLQWKRDDHITTVRSIASIYHRKKLHLARYKEKDDRNEMEWNGTTARKKRESMPNKWILMNIFFTEHSSSFAFTISSHTQTIFFSKNLTNVYILQNVFFSIISAEIDKKWIYCWFLTWIDLNSLVCLIYWVSSK